MFVCVCCLILLFDFVFRSFCSFLSSSSFSSASPLPPDREQLERGGSTFCVEDIESPDGVGKRVGTSEGGVLPH